MKLLNLALATVLATASLHAEPLKIAYSDWPGWVAWDIAASKGWFKEAGVDVKLEWFEYAPSMEAYSAGQVDAVMMTNGDALVTGANGKKSVMIILTDFSNGNDMIVAKPGIKSLADLKGKKIGLETGFVEHLLLIKGLEKAGMKESDITIVNTPTHQTAQTLASGDVDAIGAWQPNSGQALKAVPGSKAILTSADFPGLIYDTIAVNPESLAARRADWEKVVKVWDKVVNYLRDPKTKDDAVKIMAARVGLTPEEYAPYLPGTQFLTLEEQKKHWSKGDGLDSLYGSSKIADSFNVANGVYKEAQAVEDYIDPSFVLGKK